MKKLLFIIIIILMGCSDKETLPIWDVNTKDVMDVENSNTGSIKQATENTKKYTVMWDIVQRETVNRIHELRDEFGLIKQRKSSIDTVEMYCAVMFKGFDNKDSAMAFIYRGRKDSTNKIGHMSIENLHIIYP